MNLLTRLIFEITSSKRFPTSVVFSLLHYIGSHFGSRSTNDARGPRRLIDPDNDLVSTTDAKGVTTTYTYDALDRELSEKAVKGSQTQTSSWS